MVVGGAEVGRRCRWWCQSGLIHCVLLRVHAKCRVLPSINRAHNMPGEKDPLVSSAKDNAEPAGEEVEIQPLFERIKDVVRVYWALGFFAFG